MRTFTCVVTILGIFICGAALTQAKPHLQCFEVLRNIKDYTAESLVSSNGDDPLSMLCSTLPEEFHDFCRTFFVANGPDVLDTVDDDHLRMICGMVGDTLEIEEEDAGSDDFVFQSEIKPSMSLDEAPIVGEEENGGELEEKELGGMVCILCENAIKIGKEYLEKHMNVLLSFVERLCGYLPMFKTTCSNLVKEYGPMVLRLLSGFIKPGLCKTLRLCPQSLEQKHAFCPAPEEIMFGTKTSCTGTRVGSTVTYACDDGYTMLMGDATRTCLETGEWSGLPTTCAKVTKELCTACDFGVGIVKDTIEDPNLTERLRLIASTLCNDMEHTEAQMCDKVVEYLSAYIPDAVDLLGSLDLNSVCEDALQCQAAKDTSNWDGYYKNA